jgi:hypothetical protein
MGAGGGVDGTVDSALTSVVVRVGTIWFVFGHRTPEGMIISVQPLITRMGVLLSETLKQERVTVEDYLRCHFSEGSESPIEDYWTLGTGHLAIRRGYPP